MTSHTTGGPRCRKVARLGVILRPEIALIVNSTPEFRKAIGQEDWPSLERNSELARALERLEESYLIAGFDNIKLLHTNTQYSLKLTTIISNQQPQ